MLATKLGATESLDQAATEMEPSGDSLHDVDLTQTACLQYKGQIVFVTSPHGAESSQAITNYFGADAGRKDPQVSHCLACNRTGLQPSRP